MKLLSFNIRHKTEVISFYNLTPSARIITLIVMIINAAINLFRTDTAFFLSLLRPGDLVEFERDGYQHWAVYIGNMVKMMIRNVMM